MEERKKRAMDKHLDFLLGQTERCVWYGFGVLSGHDVGHVGWDGRVLDEC